MQEEEGTAQGGGGGGRDRTEALEEEVGRLRETILMQQELIQQTRATILGEGLSPSD